MAHLLVVDDERSICELLEISFRKDGHKVELASNGEDAKRRLASRVFDIVVSDICMPDMDGLQATRAIRSKYDSLRQPRIVAMTANAMQGDREMCLQAGMDDYVSKPIQVKELQRALEQMKKK